MRVAILFNPKSGRGRAASVASEFETSLTQAGHLVQRQDLTESREGAKDALAWCEVVVVAGGDGTLHHTLPLLIGSGRPIYHAALGTENLFAREHGHRPEPKALLAAMKAWNIRTLDVGQLQLNSSRPIPFAVVASLGPDASMVHRLASTRRGPIRRLSYLGPMVHELLGPRVPRVTIRVDGREVVRDRRGLVLLANLRQYALASNPAYDADPTDGRLDLAFLPGRSAARLFLSLLACKLGRGEWWTRATSGAIAARGNRFEMVVEWALLPQADGEAIMPEGDLRAAKARVTASCMTAAIQTFVVCS